MLHFCHLPATVAWLEDAGGTAMALICRYVQDFDFDDHKGWDAYLGQHAEGQITWQGPTHELVVNEGHEVGFYWSGYTPNHELDGGPYPTFEKAQEAFEEAIFGKR